MKPKLNFKNPPEFPTAASKMPCERLLKPAAFASAAMMSPGHTPNSASSSTAAVTSNGCPLNSAASEMPRKYLVKSTTASASAAKVSSKHPPRPLLLCFRPSLCSRSRVGTRTTLLVSQVNRLWSNVRGENGEYSECALSTCCFALVVCYSSNADCVIGCFPTSAMLQSVAALPINSCAALDAGGGASLLKWPPEESSKKKDKKRSSYLSNPIKGGGFVSSV
uniref:Uncharacterized protein n=1 Tax=Ditylenchus dipsaci TaxID=166011 RepID=A0A915DD88_9BILA